ncbi:hypothetical protein DP42_6550 [Burkholderia pseudomallei]|nr:methyltransferase type 12 domain protein [Burkholderia pseudomallei]KGD34864.1 hypothetical protein DP42_6550 [Burkholderia pseudomallei]
MRPRERLLGAHARHELRNQQRIAARREKILVGGDALRIEHRFPQANQAREQRLRVARTNRPAMRRPRLVNPGDLRKRAPVDLAVRRDGQTLERAQLRRHHVARHALGGEREQFVGVDARGVRFHAREQDVVAERVERAVRLDAAERAVARRPKPFEPLRAMHEQSMRSRARIAGRLHHQALADADLRMLGGQLLDHPPRVGRRQRTQPGDERDGVARVVQRARARDQIDRMRRDALRIERRVHVEADEAHPRIRGEALARRREEIARHVAEQIVDAHARFGVRRERVDDRARRGGRARADLEDAPRAPRLARDDAGHRLGHRAMQRAGVHAVAVHRLGDMRRALRKHQAGGRHAIVHLLAETGRARTEIVDQHGGPQRRRRVARERVPAGIGIGEGDRAGGIRRASRVGARDAPAGWRGRRVGCAG